MKKSTLVTDVGEFYRLLLDETHDVDNVVEMTCEAMLVTTTPKAEEFEDCLPNTNILVATFTTAQAQLELYSYMEKLGKRCLYTDTGKQ